MTQPHDKQSTPAWRLLRAMLLACAAAGALLGTAMFMLGEREALLAAGAGLSRVKPYLVAVHFVLIGALWWKWTAVVDFLLARGKLQPGIREQALAARNRTALLLLAMEVFVVIGFPFASLG